MSISTHVLDLVRGVPASGLKVTLSRRSSGGSWAVVDSGLTDASGRITRVTATQLDPGEYRLEFATAAYFKRSGATPFYPEVSIVFTLDDTVGHLHLPLLLSQFGYTTYKGA